MNQKELSELKRRFRPDKSAIHRIYGCFVNGNKEIVSYLDESMGRMPEEESAQYLGFLKKALSGTLGKQLIDIVFSTQQVVDSQEHKLLSALRDSQLKDAQARELPDSSGSRRLRRAPPREGRPASGGLGHGVLLSGLLRLSGEGQQGGAGLLPWGERVPQPGRPGGGPA